jgi:hypothetical protein
MKKPTKPPTKNQYISVYEYALKHKLSNDTLMRWIKKGKITDIKRIIVERVLINKDYKHKK